MLTRTLKLELHPTNRQRSLMFDMMRASAQIYNLLVEHLQYKLEVGRALHQQYPDAKAWELDPYTDIRRKGWADELVIAFVTQQQSLYPQQFINKPAKQGKLKGQERLVIATRKNAKPDYGIPAQSKGALCRDFEANVQSYFSHRKNGNGQAELPKRFKGLHSLFFTGQLVTLKGDRLTIGASPYKLKFRLPELQGIEINGDATITRSRSGKFYLHLTRKLPEALNPDLTEVAAIDFGQKRAMVLALKDGTTATISGKDVLALKRERDGRYREINRLRSRVLRGQIRQYLTSEEKATYRELQERDNDRQATGQPRRGMDIKYALRIIRQRRQEQGLSKRSKRERKLHYAQSKAGDYYRIRLSYANHCITRSAVDWCIENHVGKIYVGKLSLPKGRKKGKRRIKQVKRNNLWEMPTQVKYLDEKMQLAGGEGTQEASEAYTSQVCPNCGRRHKPRNRVYFCNPRKGGCGWTGDRDGVGATNFLSSVLNDGELGKIKPVSNRTLRIAPAIRQGLAMHSPDSSAICEPVEATAKGSTVLTVQEPPIVDGSTTPKTVRNALPKGKTQARGGIEVLATSDPIGFDDTCSQSTTINNRGDDARQRRRLQNQPVRYVQLDFWDAL